MFWNDEQSRIYEEIKTLSTNLLVNARAGSGKTTTLIECLNLLPQNVKILFLAFNRTIVDELSKRINNPSIEIATFHSMGWSIVRKKYSRLIPKLNESKVNDLLKSNPSTFIKSKDKTIFEESMKLLPKIVSLMKQTLSFDKEDVKKICYQYSLTLNDDIINSAIKLHQTSNSVLNKIDFDDAVALSIGVKESTKYDIVFVDECQDLNKAQQQLVLSSLSKNGKFVAIGDDCQAIYGFAGADVYSFDRFRYEMGEVKELSLPVSYRCSKKIVNYAKRIVPSIEHTSTAPEGLIEFEKEFSDVKNNDWVLCRNTIPLIEAKIRLNLLGINSIIRGESVSETRQKLLNVNGHKIDESINKGEQDGLIESSEVLKDMRELFEVYDKETILNNIKMDDSKTAKTKEQKEFVTLSTVHKAKGAENARVFCYRKDLLPSPSARLDWEMRQERNLEYVQITRAKEYLGFLNNTKNK